MHYHHENKFVFVKPKGMVVDFFFYNILPSSRLFQAAATATINSTQIHVSVKCMMSSKSLLSYRWQ